MEKIKISNHAELQLQILQLRKHKFTQEKELKNSLKEFIYTLNPLSIVKDSLHKLAEDKEVRLDLTKVGLNMGANILIDKVLGKGNSIKGFLSALLVEKFSAAFINKNIPTIISGISKILNNNSLQKTNV